MDQPLTEQKPRSEARAKLMRKEVSKRERQARRLVSEQKVHLTLDTLDSIGRHVRTTNEHLACYVEFYQRSVSKTSVRIDRRDDETGGCMIDSRSPLCTYLSK